MHMFARMRMSVHANTNVMLLFLTDLFLTATTKHKGIPFATNSFTLQSLVW